MRKATQKEFLQAHTDLMFQKINHQNHVSGIGGVGEGLFFVGKQSVCLAQGICQCLKLPYLSKQ